MKKTSKRRPAADEMRPEYDFSNGVRNKYVARMVRGGMLVVLEPNVAQAFRDAKAVNHALRTLLDALPQPPRPRARRKAARAKSKA